MKRSRIKLLLCFLAIAMLAWVVREPLRRRLVIHVILNNDAPPAENVADMIERAPDKEEALLTAWRSGKIVHREVAIRELGRLFSISQSMPPKLEALLQSATLDPDINVREAALSILSENDDPALPSLAAEQLKDPDEQVRLLGLNYLKLTSPAVGARLVAGLLDDPSPAVAGLSIKSLERWSGEFFGVKLANTVLVENKTNGLPEFQAEGVAKTAQAAERAGRCWVAHQNEFPPGRLDVPKAALDGRLPLRVGDFQLRTLDGRNVHLSDFRGKVVLINFWTTWCTACIGEIPELIALQNRHSDKFAILGISQDLLPDEDGEHPIQRQGIPEQVARVVHERGINYPIILDGHNEVGGRFYGGELPTTVIIDARGNPRRRFVGARSLAVFDAMLAEAQLP